MVLIVPMAIMHILMLNITMVIVMKIVTLLIMVMCLMVKIMIIVVITKMVSIVPNRSMMCCILMFMRIKMFIIVMPVMSPVKIIVAVMLI
jgi:hypothetical protein